MRESYSVSIDGCVVDVALRWRPAVALALACCALGEHRGAVVIREATTDELRAYFVPTSDGWSARSVPGWLQVC